MELCETGRIRLDVLRYDEGARMGRVEEGTREEVGVMFEVVVDKSAQANGLAVLLSDLIKKNIENAPWKEGDARAIRGDISIYANDADMSITLSFRGNELVILDGTSPKSSIKIEADSASLIDMSRIKLVVRIPWFFDSDGMKIVRYLLTRKVKIIMDPLKALDLARLLRIFSIYG